MRILYLDLDTLRPDHLGCYGYHRNTSPNLDRIAREGVRFDNYYCADAPCLPSRAALVSGQFGIHNGAINHGGTTGDMRPEGRDRGFRTQLGNGQSLWAFLRHRGLNTVSVSPFAERHSAWWFYAGFREMHDTGKGGNESAEEVTPTALEWINSHAREDNWLLHVNYWDPHTPYRAPESFGNPFASDPLPAWMDAKMLERHRRHVGPHGAREISMYDNRPLPQYPRHPGELKDMHDLRRMIDGYDCGIRYMDEHIGRLIAALGEAGVMDDLAIIVSSDHGENMGELEIYGEHATADHGTCRIPMIIRWPGAKQGHVDRDLHVNVDLAPTLAELLKAPAHARWDGRSYAAAVRDGASCGREDIVISQCAHVCQRGVRFGPWMYIRTYHDGFHLFPQEMLFNLESDPHEQADLAATHPGPCREGAWRLMRWHDQMMATMSSEHAADPMWTVIREGGPLHARGQLARYCERLEQTERGWAVPELKRRHPGEFKA